MTSSKAVAFAAAMTLTPTIASAGGLELTGQPIDIIFEEGNYIEGRVGIVIPELEGSNPFLSSVGIPGNDSFGDTVDNTPFFTLGAKTDFTDRISGAVLYDTPYLRDTTYSRGIFEGTSGQVDSNSITGILRFKANKNFSVYGGPRVQFSSVDLQSPFVRDDFLQIDPSETSGFDIDVSDTDFGYVLGGAIEIPDLQARVAVTYNSEITHDFDSVETFSDFVTPDEVPFPIPAPGLVLSSTTEGQFDVTTPQSINLDVQFPVSTSTLVKANVRWVDWSSVDFSPPGFVEQFGQPVVVYTDDTVTYRLTVAQRLNDNFSAFVTGSYEEQGDEEVSLFKTFDGGFSLGGGVVVENGQGLKMTLAGEYRELFAIDGVQSPVLPVPSDLDDGKVFALSLKFGYNF